MITSSVTPAKRGPGERRIAVLAWVPAFAGMTIGGASSADAATPLDRRRLRQLPGAVRHLARSERRRGGRGDRPERRRQDHADAGDLRPDPADARQHADGRRRPRRHTGAPHRRTRHRARAGEPPPVPAHDGRGQPPHGRLHPGGAAEIPRTARFRLSAVPPPARTPHPARRHDVGRRTADVRDRPRADVGTDACCCSTNRPPAWRR